MIDRLPDQRVPKNVDELIKANCYWRVRLFGRLTYTSIHQNCYVHARMQDASVCSRNAHLLRIQRFVPLSRMDARTLHYPVGLFGCHFIDTGRRRGRQLEGVIPALRS